MDYRSLWTYPDKIVVKKLVNGDWVECDSFDDLNEFGDFIITGMRLWRSLLRAEGLQRMGEHLAEMIDETPIPTPFLEAF